MSEPAENRPTPATERARKRYAEQAEIGPLPAVEPAEPESGAAEGGQADDRHERRPKGDA